ncbi:hypothetical protein [Thalassomonas haliotis]|uniref:Uncharacterized protein n=1 Tax=Thalassomonas haliotis TaxID=485448 RepID=A0ABY7VL60_9GAMM|nr:hypothetical protein [Thalassomonas haliotis]WDE14341.1 hypothetical protein H3N35_13495 [Thalassomonas haliotis]
MTQEKKGTEAADIEKQDELEVQSVGVSLDDLEEVAGGAAVIDGRDGYTNCCNGCD